MSAPTKIRRFVVLYGGEEIPVELGLGEDGRLDYRVGEQAGSSQMTVAREGRAVLLQSDEENVAIRIARKADGFQVATRDHNLKCEVYPEARFLLARMHGQLGGEGVVQAQMPGSVVRVLVSAGDEVEAGQGLLILEAMKMENEVLAPRSGRVQKLVVKEGDTVESGSVMMEIGDG